MFVRIIVCNAFLFLFVLQHFIFTQNCQILQQNPSNYSLLSLIRNKFPDPSLKVSRPRPVDIGSAGLTMVQTDTTDSGWHGCSSFLAYPVLLWFRAVLSWFLQAFDCTLISHYYLLTYLLTGGAPASGPLGWGHHNFMAFCRSMTATVPKRPNTSNRKNVRYTFSS